MPHVRRRGEGTCRGTRRNAAGRVQGIEPRSLSFVEPAEPTPNKKDKSPPRRWATSGRYFWSHRPRPGSGQRGCPGSIHPPWVVLLGTALGSEQRRVGREGGMPCG